MNLKHVTFALLVASLLTLASSAAAAPAVTVPTTVGYQGRLYDDAGVPIDGTVSLAFALYASASGGAPAWSETQAVTFTNGYFAVQLGTVSPLDATVFTGSTLYLGVTVGSDPELAPRTVVSSVPYAVTAGRASTAGTASFATNASYATSAGSAPPDARFGNSTAWAWDGQTDINCYIGEVKLTAGATAAGVVARGQLLPISGNEALFSLLGTTFGGDGISTFALPDLQSSAPNGLSYYICTQGIFPSRN